jgi:hypothetical protein
VVAIFGFGTLVVTSLVAHALALLAARHLHEVALGGRKETAALAAEAGGT